MQKIKNTYHILKFMLEFLDFNTRILMQTIDDKCIDSFMQALYSNKCITYELCPDRSASVDNLIEKVKKAGLECMESKLNAIDAFVCTDLPLAKLKHHCTLAAIKLQQNLKKPVVCTTSMRDKNSLSLSAEILGLNEFNVRLFLALSGDSIKLGDQPQAKAVFEGNSLRILEIIECLNKGRDLNGNEIHGEIKSIHGFTVMDSYSKNKDVLKKKMESKIKGGAKAIFTQPIYDIPTLDTLLEWLDEINAKYNQSCVLMHGFFPLTRYKVALFLRDSLPGVFLPNHWVEDLESASLKGIEYEREIGMQKSMELFSSLYKKHPKIHFMNNNNTMYARKILDSIL